MIEQVGRPRFIHKELPPKDAVGGGLPVDKFNPDPMVGINQMPLAEDLSDYDEVIRGLDIPDTATFFFRRLSKYPLLEVEQEKMVFDAIDSGMPLDDLADDNGFWDLVYPGDEDRFENVFKDSKSLDDVMVLCNLRLVVSVAKKHQGRGLPLMDLVQEGMTGLMRSIETFDQDRGFTFGTYATWWIRSAITHARDSDSTTIRLPAHVREGLNRAFAMSAEHYAKTGIELTLEELETKLLNETSIAETNIKGAIQAIRNKTVTVSSLDDPLKEDEDTTVGDMIADPKSHVEEGVLEHHSRVEVSNEIKHELETSLDERERRIVSLRAGLEDGEKRTLEEVGGIFDLTRERIRQIEAKALEKLRGNERLRKRWEGWEDEIPSFVYGQSAEKAALKLGLLADIQKEVIPAPQAAKEVDAIPPEVEYNYQGDFTTFEEVLVRAMCDVNEAGTGFKHPSLIATFKAAFSTPNIEYMDTGERRMQEGNVYKRGIYQLEKAVAKLRGMRGMEFDDNPRIAGFFNWLDKNPLFQNLTLSEVVNMVDGRIKFRNILAKVSEPTAAIEKSSVA